MPELVRGRIYVTDIGRAAIDSGIIDGPWHIRIEGDVGVDDLSSERPRIRRRQRLRIPRIAKPREQGRRGHEADVVDDAVSISPSALGAQRLENADVMVPAIGGERI